MHPHRSPILMFDVCFCAFVLLKPINDQTKCAPSAPKAHRALSRARTHVTSILVVPADHRRRAKLSPKKLSHILAHGARVRKLNYNRHRQSSAASTYARARCTNNKKSTHKKKTKNTREHHLYSVTLSPSTPAVLQTHTHTHDAR